MIEAFGWGILAGSSLLVGGAIGAWAPVPKRVLGAIMAFGAGVLISAVAYELVEEALRTSGGGVEIALGLAAGCAVFFVGDALIDRAGGRRRKRSTGDDEGSGPAIVLGAVLDGIPESIVIGLSLLGGASVSVAVIAAVFLSNLPEGISGSTGLKRSGWSRRRILGMWALVTLVTGLASLAGFSLFGGTPPTVVAFMLSFAGGAILTMLADTMMPEAFEAEGHSAVTGVMTTLGFGVAFALSAVG